MGEWNTGFHGIAVQCSDRMIRVKNDDALTGFLSDPDTKGALLVAKYARALYEKEMGKPIAITEDSLAIEILGHVYAGTFAEIAEKFHVPVLKTVMGKIRERTDIIDCGEREVDNNRFVWDELEHMKLKNIIYTMCGRMA